MPRVNSSSSISMFASTYIEINSVVLFLCMKLLETCFFSSEICVCFL